MSGEHTKKQWVLIFIVFLATVTLFSAVRYIALRRENRYLYNNLSRIKEQIDSLEEQRQNLLQTIYKQNQENLIIKENLEAHKDKLTKMEADFIQARKTIRELASLSASLKAENADLKSQSENLKIQISQVSREKDALEGRSNSVEELKKAIRHIKNKIRQLKRELYRKDNLPPAIEGNRGFLIKDGKSTYRPAKIIIEVKPLP
ncbi:MAG: hypothetical protein PHQ57_06505 [Candidatus Omnitrophica bacterium]|nr:hypothetical protein [Candidatus Omnitrophota bacterium]